VPQTRPSSFVAAALAALLLLTACGDDGGSASETPVTEPATETTASAAGTYPVSIEHAWGSTEIVEEPQRVVLVGLTDQDVLLSIGVTPIAVREFFGEKPFATWPWAADLLGDAEPAVLPNQGLNYEEIAALQPDLILGLYAGLTEEEYGTLSEIAPTVAQSKDHPAWAAPWQEQLRIAGEIFGRQSEAAEVAARTEKAFADTAAAHPEFEGKTAVVAWDFGDGNVGLYSPEDPRSLFVESLGFTFPDAITAIDYAGSFSYLLSAEQLSLLEADVLILVDNTAPGQVRVLDSDVYESLATVADGRVVVLPRTAELTGAFGFNTPLAIPAALEGLAPRLQAAVDGDPTTVVEPAE
jgi:iron complex transport system substrate-binding protein